LLDPAQIIVRDSTPGVHCGSTPLNAFHISHTISKEILCTLTLHCVPKKLRQNSNHYNYGISYQN